MNPRANHSTPVEGARDNLPRPNTAIRNDNSDRNASMLSEISPAVQPTAPTRQRRNPLVRQRRQDPGHSAETPNSDTYRLNCTEGAIDEENVVGDDRNRMQRLRSIFEHLNLNYSDVMPVSMITSLDRAISAIDTPPQTVRTDPSTRQSFVDQLDME